MVKELSVKICNVCNKIRSKRNYYKNKRYRPNGKAYWTYRPECKDCFREISQLRYKEKTNVPSTRHRNRKKRKSR